MKLIYLVGILGLTAVACQREDEAASGSSSKRKLPVKSGEESEAQPGTRSAKASNRGQSKKPIPMAEPVPGKPGFVKSPNSGNIVDVTLIPAGTVMADPGFPVEEEKFFRVPVMADLAEATEKAVEPPAALVPNKPGFVVNPYDKTEFDASQFEPGAVVMDPGSTPEAPRFFQVPGNHVQSDE
jgi:hypothetical protein